MTLMTLRGQTALKLPVGDVPDWEVDGSDAEHPDLKSPAESFVILQSLKQSREKWLRSMFPKFSSRGRGGKQPDVVPPPHTIYNRGRCTLQIGPHFFMDTTVFEVHYRPLPMAVPQQTTFVYQPAVGNPPLQSDHHSQCLPPASSSSSGESNALPPTLSSTLLSSPSLLSQVNAAAKSNPTLANLLQMAASEQATPEQLQTLGLLIRSIASSPVTGTSASPSSATGPDSSSTLLPTSSVAIQQYQYQTVVKEFDIVMEFREAPSDRWIFPRGPATCEFTSTSGVSGSFGDITISTVIPFPSMLPQGQPESEMGATTELPPKQVVQFHFRTASSCIWEAFIRWVGTKEKMEENRKILADIEPTEQKFLAYRLPEGSQLTQIQNAAVQPYAMKSIKPLTENGRSKRRPAPRKPAQDTTSSPAVKRKRPAQQKNHVSHPKIACSSCDQADVPLIMGGRYCRPCAEGALGNLSK